MRRARMESKSWPRRPRMKWRTRLTCRIWRQHRQQVAATDDETLHGQNAAMAMVRNPSWSGSSKKRSMHSTASQAEAQKIDTDMVPCQDLPTFRGRRRPQSFVTSPRQLSESFTKDEALCWHDCFPGERCKRSGGKRSGAKRRSAWSGRTSKVGIFCSSKRIWPKTQYRNGQFRSAVNPVPCLSETVKATTLTTKVSSKRITPVRSPPGRFTDMLIDNKPMQVVGDRSPSSCGPCCKLEGADVRNGGPRLCEVALGRSRRADQADLCRELVSATDGTNTATQISSDIFAPQMIERHTMR